MVGTEFVVNNRSSRTHVALNSGKIRLKLEQTNQVLNMSPGDVVEYDASSNKLLSRRKDVGPSKSWLKNFEESGQSGSSSQSGSDASIGVTRGVKVDQNPDSRQGSNQADVQSLQSNSSDGTKQTNPSVQQHDGSRTAPSNKLQVFTKGSSHKQGGNMGSTGKHYILQPKDPKDAGSKNNVSVVKQSGNQNTAYIEQIGEDLASRQDQSGNQNQASAQVSGGKDGSDDLDWSSWQKQQGSGNVSIFNIVESYNTNVYSQQYGHSNDIEVYSSGRNNKGIIIQDGNQNMVDINQRGEANQVSGLDPLAPGVLQKGSFNEVDIMQQGTGNQSRNIQKGRNNEINVNQNGNLK